MIGGPTPTNTVITDDIPASIYSWFRAHGYTFVSRSGEALTRWENPERGRAICRFESPRLASISYSVIGIQHTIWYAKDAQGHANEVLR